MKCVYRIILWNFLLVACALRFPSTFASADGKPPLGPVSLSTGLLLTDDARFSLGWDS